jgi:hypothetical protein
MPAPVAKSGEFGNVGSNPNSHEFGYKVGPVRILTNSATRFPTSHEFDYKVGPVRILTNSATRFPNSHEFGYNATIKAPSVVGQVAQVSQLVPLFWNGKDVTAQASKRVSSRLTRSSVVSPRCRVMKALHQPLPIRRLTGWLNHGVIAALLMVSLSPATAQDEMSVQITDTLRPDSKLVVRVIKPPAPPESAIEFPVEQTVYWPEEPTASPEPDEGNLLTRTGRLLRRALNPITPPMLRATGTSSQPTRQPTSEPHRNLAASPVDQRPAEAEVALPETNLPPAEAPRTFTPQEIAMPTSGHPAAAIRQVNSPLPRRTVLGENSVSSLERVLLAQQQFQAQATQAVPDVAPSETVAPPKIVAPSEPVTPRKLPVERFLGSPSPAFARLTNASASEPGTRFVRGPDGRLTRIAAGVSRSLPGNSTVPLLPMDVKVDELAEFLAPKQETRQSEMSDAAGRTSWQTSAEQQDTLSANPSGDGLKPIRGVRTDAHPLSEDNLPDDAAAEHFARLGSVRHGPGTNRDWDMVPYWWNAPALCHSPLYYEEINLERYGYSHGLLQPAFSAAHFFGVTLSMPYLMTASPPRDCQYTLGHYRPGSYAPAHLYRPPFSLRAGAAQAAAVSGLMFLAP